MRIPLSELLESMGDLEKTSKKLCFLVTPLVIDKFSEFYISLSSLKQTIPDLQLRQDRSLFHKSSEMHGNVGF